MMLLIATHGRSRLLKSFGIAMEDILMVALTNINLPQEAWRSARLLRAIPNCRLVLMLAYQLLSPALSTEEAGLMTYLPTPPDAGPSVNQATAGLQNWKRAGRRLAQIGGRLPMANQLQQSFVTILSKHLAANKKLSFAFQRKSSTMPMMNPSPTEIVELFTFCGSDSCSVCHGCGVSFQGCSCSCEGKAQKGE